MAMTNTRKGSGGQAAGKHCQYKRGCAQSEFFWENSCQGAANDETLVPIPVIQPLHCESEFPNIFCLLLFLPEGGWNREYL